MQRFFAWFLTQLLGLSLLITWTVTNPNALETTNSGSLADLFIPGVAVALFVVGTLAFFTLAILRAVAPRLRRPRLWVLGGTLLASVLLLHFGLIAWVITAGAMALERHLPVGRRSAT